MVFERERMLEYLTSEQAALRDIELVAAIINSQSNILLMLIKKSRSNSFTFVTTT